MSPRLLHGTHVFGEIEMKRKLGLLKSLVLLIGHLDAELGKVAVRKNAA